jgi:hypothetical protein
MAVVVPAQGQTAEPPVDSFNERPACQALHTPNHVRSYVKKVFRRDNITRKALKRVRVLRGRLCGKDRRQALRFVRKHRRAYKERQRRLQSLTPYCANGQCWAIPVQIVMCESGGRWDAYNPSGAMGPYQLLGWLPRGASKMAQHRMAAKLWNGGAGASHWVCKA